MKKKERILLFAALGIYMSNKLWIKQFSDNWFIQRYLNDVMAGICLTVLCYGLSRVWLRRELFGREAVILILAVGAYWEYAAPLYIPYSISDKMDILAYLLGGLTAIGVAEKNKKIYIWGEERMKCKKCGCDLKSREQFCSECGTMITSVCPKCGQEVQDDVKFCGVCGYHLSGNAEAGATPEEVAGCAAKESETETHDNVCLKAEQRTRESFKKELSQLSENDGNSKAAILWLGTKILEKHFLPILWNNEHLIQIEHIQSKTLFAQQRREFVAITDKRVIKFEKLQYFSPKFEICTLGSIKEITADAPSNVISGTFVGEKLSVIHQEGQINMRMVGKGAALQLKNSILQEKEKGGNIKHEYHNNELQSSNSKTHITEKSQRNKKGSKKKAIIGLGITAVIIGALLFFGGGETGTELSEYIPLARADVMNFVERNELEEIAADFIYGNNDLTITLSDKGNINIIIIETQKYSLYGLKVGEKFLLPDDGKKLTEQNYGFIGEYGDRVVYGVMSGRDTPGGDRMIGITLDSASFITKLEFMKSGAQDLLDEESDVSGSELELEKPNETEVNSSADSTQEVLGTEYQDYMILPESGSRYYDEYELSGLTKEQLRLARNEIYARHGRAFQTEDLNQYFSSQPWYNGYLSAEEFDDSVLNGFEKANLDIIKRVESGYQPIEGQLPAYLQIDDVWNSEFGSDGAPVHMILGQTENGYYLQFIRTDNDNDLIWSGTPQSYSNNENGGLEVYAVGEDLYQGISNNPIIIKWNSPEEIDHPNVSAADANGNNAITGNYSY